MTSPQEGATPGISALHNLLAHPPGLPVAKQLSEVARALSGGAVVIQAPPGTGKTTLIPPLVAQFLAGRAARIPEDDSSRHCRRSFASPGYN